MAGANACSLSPANPKSDEQQINVIEAAKAAGAEYIVKVSGGRDVIGPNVESVNGQAHYKIEEHLKKSGLKWCILSPGLFMQNIMGQAASIKNDGKIIQPWPKDLPVALIDVRDTGALARAAARAGLATASSTPSAAWRDVRDFTKGSAR